LESLLVKWIADLVLGRPFLEGCEELVVDALLDKYSRSSTATLMNIINSLVFLFDGSGNNMGVQLHLEQLSQEYVTALDNWIGDLKTRERLT
jgi:hypothetical protein